MLVIFRLRTKYYLFCAQIVSATENTKLRSVQIITPSHKLRFLRYLSIEAPPEIRQTQHQKYHKFWYEMIPKLDRQKQINF